MYELVPAGPQCWYIQSPAKAGLILAADNEVCLIDSGSDKEAGRRIRQILDKQGWRLKAIINTHSNADHIGGNRYLQNQTHCPIFAAGIEAALTRHPILEPAFLYGGYPPRDLRHKFLLAEESDAQDISSPDFPKDLGVIELPGHFFQMIGIRSPGNTVFLGDCVSSLSTLEKYRITFIYDVDAYLKTLSLLEGLDADLYVPAHAEATKDLSPLIRANRETVLSIAEKICTLCAGEGLSFETILKELFSCYGLTMNFEQYVLTGSTVKSYLAWLRDSGKLDVEFRENMLLWRSV
ncbi:MAG: MBL fold metallo-hydrolase [Spirochaetaceae bacterium]|jgi:glyoxylase-like metal-dependent hydrolase (beta-lactamase superfamily II)|nr:MBL fold metallo-hydrolase [Spirochaetaceae bacterium]